MSQPVPQLQILGRARDPQAEIIQAIAPSGWQRYVLLAAARGNRGDEDGMRDAMGVLLRMVADDLGGTREAVEVVERAAGIR